MSVRETIVERLLARVRYTYCNASSAVKLPELVLSGFAYVGVLRFWLTEGELSTHDVSVKLNEIPMSATSYANPRETLKSLKLEPDKAN
jgi:hypothetical protein